MEILEHILGIYFIGAICSAIAFAKMKIVEPDQVLKSAANWLWTWYKHFAKK